MDPFQAVTDMMSEMNRMRQLGRTGYEPVHEERQRTRATAWVPTADIFARGADVVMRVELAGVRADEVDITISEGVLTVSGEREGLGEDEEEGATFYVRERFYGAFRRSVSLPAGIDESSISADFENGVVEIVVRGGAAAAAEPKRIAVRDRSAGS